MGQSWVHPAFFCQCDEIELVQEAPCCERPSVPQTEKRCEIESLSSGDLSPFLTHFTYLFQLLREFLVTLDSFPSICCVQLFWDAVRLK